MIYKITPVVDRAGLTYRVREYRDGFFGTKHTRTMIDDNRFPEGIDDSYRQFLEEAIFNTPEQAINALKQYGGEEALRNLVEWAPL